MKSRCCTPHYWILSWIALISVCVVGVSSGGAEPFSCRDLVDMERECDSFERCNTPKLCRFFKKGAEKGCKLVDKVWKRIKSCDRVDEFAVVVLDEILLEIELRKDNEDKDHKRCRYAGSMEGLFAELDRIQIDCWQNCFMDGELVGEIEAKAFCDLVIESDGDVDAEEWLRRPINTCGFAYQLACDATFLGVCLTYENEFGTCEQYISEPYFEVWNRTRLQACEYPEQ